MNKRLSAYFLSLVTVGLLSACGKGPDIPFAPTSGELYSDKPDFSSVEYHYPLTPADLMKVTPKNINKLTQEQMDQLYARLTAGPIPDGPFDGQVIFPKGGSGKLRAAEIIGGLKGVAVGLKGKKLEFVAESLWKGKVFYRNERVLRNRIEDLKLLKPVISGDIESIKKISVKGKDAYLLFPAKLYCGQSLLDGRRESLIIDYAFSDEIEGYRESPDFLAGRRGFKVRDEVRMIRPGFYLGRAYLDRAFVLNFTLYNEEIAGRDTPDFIKTGQRADDCWTGTVQPPPAMAAK